MSAESQKLHLVNYGDFKLSRGGTSKWKLDCDALPDEDIHALAKVIVSHCTYERSLQPVLCIGVPKGGNRLAFACNEIVKKPSEVSPEKRCILIVDDVYTTGYSMTNMLEWVRSPQYQIVGYVIFARNLVNEKWITPLFTCNQEVFGVL